MRKYLLCRPKGGLNDTLCQIEKCWRYAETHGRILVVDAKQSGLLDDFAVYFEQRRNGSDVKLSLDNEMLLSMDQMNVRPETVSGRIADYEAYYEIDVHNYLEAKSSRQLAFDMERDHPETLLVHHQCGGGAMSVDCLERLKLRSRVAAEVNKRLSTIDGSYSAIHVRNTDMDTDYRPFFEEMKPKLTGKTVLMCSDDVGCIEYAKRYFDESNVVTISDIPDTGGQSLHEGSAFYGYTVNLDAIADLLAMAASEEVLFANTTRGTVSGYSRFARLLNRRQDIVRGLLSP